MTGTVVAFNDEWVVTRYDYVPDPAVLGDPGPDDEWKGVMIKRRKPATVNATAALAKLDKEDAELGEKLRYAGVASSGISLREFKRLNSVVGIWNGRFPEHNPYNWADVWRNDVRACNAWNKWADAHGVPKVGGMGVVIDRVLTERLPGFHRSWYTRP